MQNKNHRKYIGVILASDMGNELFPLVHNFPMSNLTVGNKRLIIYQLEQFQCISDISTIIVIHSQDSIRVKQFLQTEFIPNHPQYPHFITFFRVENKQSQYTTLQKLLASNLCENFQFTKGIIIVPPNIISSVKFSTLLDEHKQKKSDVTMLLKQKKQFGKDEKKPDVDFQPQIDIALYNAEGEIFALSDIQNYDYSGFAMNSSVYHRINRASFQKVVDSQVYVLGQRVIKIIKNLVNSELAFIKIDLIDMLVRNQTNSTLLNIIGEQSIKPLRVIAKITNQNEYIRRITNVKIYESVNLDSLIRGPKQKDVLMPNAYTQQIDEKAIQQYKGCLIGSGCQIDNGNKLMRNIIENGCKIGKNVEINNSIIMAGSVIEDGCKIVGSSIGPNCVIKAQSIISFCQLAMGCVIEKGSNFEKQPMIPTE